MRAGVLFTTPNVRAILAGTKTVTRRFASRGPVLMGPKTGTRAVSHREYADLLTAGGLEKALGWCPHGGPGATLWVRETWAALINSKTLRLRKHEALPSDMIVYYADGRDMGYGFSWRPSIHMPRWASRIDLTVLSVRIEPLQDMDEPDAIAEGVTSVKAYAAQWDVLYADTPWACNPWVWRIEFVATRKDPSR